MKVQQWGRLVISRHLLAFPFQVATTHTIVLPSRLIIIGFTISVLHSPGFLVNPINPVFALHYKTKYCTLLISLYYLLNKLPSRNSINQCFVV